MNFRFLAGRASPRCYWRNSKISIRFLGWLHLQSDPVAFPMLALTDRPRVDPGVGTCFAAMGFAACCLAVAARMFAFFYLRHNYYYAGIEAYFWSQLTVPVAVLSGMVVIMEHDREAKVDARRFMIGVA